MLTYGFVVIAFLISSSNGVIGHPIPFASMQACETALFEMQNFYIKKNAKCILTGAINIPEIPTTNTYRGMITPLK